ncbi:MAG: hypothetical protein HY064_03780 [Bacteroidetes bacterium]|nr:hypothetical protein [Bacteroidota bacterium]
MELSHDFFVTENKFNVNNEIELFPSKECALLIRNNKMRFIKNGSGFITFYEAYLDAAPVTPIQKPLVPLTGSSEFLFVLRLKQEAIPYFLNVTDLNQGGAYNSGKIFFLEANAGLTTPADIPFSPSLIDELRPSSFTYSFLPGTPGFTADLTVKVFPEGSAVPVITVTPVVVDLTNGTYTVAIDLTKQPKGIYTIEAKDGFNTLEHSAILYVDSDLAKENLFGLARIKYSDSARLYDSCNDPKDFFNFEYTFDVRSTTWRYYIIPKEIDPSNFDLAVKDDQVVPAYTFNAVDPTTQPFGQPTSLMKINGKNPVIMESTVPIPFSETALNTITLFKRATGGSGVGIKVLPGLSNALTTGVDSDRLGAAQPTPIIDPDVSEIFVIA